MPRFGQSLGRSSRRVDVDDGQCGKRCLALHDGAADRHGFNKLSGRWHQSPELNRQSTDDVWDQRDCN